MFVVTVMHWYNTVTLTLLVKFRIIWVDVNPNPCGCVPFGLGRVHRAQTTRGLFDCVIDLTRITRWVPVDLQSSIVLEMSSSGESDCAYWREFLPHAKFPVLKCTFSRASEGWTTIHRFSVEKMLSEQRAYTIYNISKAQPNRCSRQKVMSILLLTFFVTSHGSY